MPEKIAFINVRIEGRDGRFFAYSEDLPGLHLCGASLADVQADIAPMIQQMYKINSNLDVLVKLAADTLSFEVPSEASNADHMRFWAAPVREALAA